MCSILQGPELGGTVPWYLFYWYLFYTNGKNILVLFLFQAVQGSAVTKRKVSPIRLCDLGFFKNIVPCVDEKWLFVVQLHGLKCWRASGCHYLPGRSWDGSACYPLSNHRLSKEPRYVYIYWLCICIGTDRET